MSLLAVLIAATFAGFPAAAGLMTLENAVVVRQSPRPTVGSGVFAVWADFDVEVRGGARQRMYQIFLVRDQFIPPVRSVCRIRFARAPLDGISSDGALDGRTLRNRVESLACDTGSWSASGRRSE